MRPAGGRGGRGMSLFARMLWLQALLATVVSVVAVSFYYVERNKTVARILAGQWAGALQTAVAHPGHVGHGGLQLLHTSGHVRLHALQALGCTRDTALGRHGAKDVQRGKVQWRGELDHLRKG